MCRICLESCSIFYHIGCLFRIYFRFIRNMIVLRRLFCNKFIHMTMRPKLRRTIFRTFLDILVVNYFFFPERVTIHY
ncbi:unnamed protein product [Schistosoma rodhaini]|nr:unnamed protein product [Schistosoma rodhaini]